ncbi:hypothetical protein [Iningainema tapete]|uniref:Uncharacterized protein n=1 Tax=Iningainema tapete BLCC-T55 TaxID=2748662 RepID=A0A8J6XUZ4_9CYAN|nr:hypothetical protein [Iningainema tapete]MBD2778221.1 hypothetical protein [Iningainema tapete BLCC-T55]
MSNVVENENNVNSLLCICCCCFNRYKNTTGTSRNPIGSICPLDTVIQVGFGAAKIIKNGKTYYDGETEVCEPKTLAEFEKIAQKEPGNWKLVMEAPLWDATWERHSDNKWVCIKSGRGFS